MSAGATTTDDAHLVSSRDEPVYFPNGSDTYCGIISAPTSGTTNSTGVVLLAGTGAGTGTIGRNRMWVTMARTLAASGITVLRFDYAGVGDSTGEMIGYDLDTPAIDALQAAFDLLSSRGLERVMVVGTCYGARTALAGSVGDSRIAGIHLLVPPVKSNTKGSAGADHLARHAGSAELARRAVSPRTIMRMIKSKGARKAARRLVSVKAQRTAAAVAGSSSPGHDQDRKASQGFERPLHRLLADGVPIHILFGMDDFYWTQFRDAAQGRLGEDLDHYKDLIRVETIQGTLRGFPTVRVQDLAVESVVNWVREHAGSQTAGHKTGGEMHTRTTAGDQASEDVTYFGAAPRMYGVTHLPDGDARAAVVICSSTHAELLKSYRLEVLLARALATQGFAVIRFHYRGAGNSEDTGEVLTLPAMINAARQARDHIVDLAGTTKLVFVGVRLGAYPATALATENPGSQLILWDPVLDTDNYMKDALRTHAIAAIRGEAKPETVKESLERLHSDGSIDLLGYEIRSEFHSSIQGRKLTDYSPEGSEVLVVPFGKSNKEDLTTLWGDNGISVTNLGAADRAAWWLAEDASMERQQRGEALASRTADWIAAATS